MAQAEIRSFGELARLALEHSDWPRDTRAQPRSLEAIFGRLDRREDLDWLVDRPGVQQVLALLLKSQVAEIRSVLVSATTPRSLLTRLRFDDLPTARALDLQQEALPPTIPQAVGLPATWKRLVWLGNPGSGFTIVKHWLVARGLAEAHSIESVEDYHALPVHGPPLYLEVPPSLCETILAKLAPTQSVCFAVASSQKKIVALFERNGFELVRNAPIEENLERIVDWVIMRSTQGCQSKRDKLLSWLKTSPLTWGTLETLGDAFGFAGAFLLNEPHGDASSTKEGFLRTWFSSRTDELARERLRDSAAMGRLLPDVLIDIAQAMLLDDTRPLLTARTVEEWLALVPVQHQRGPDLDWLSAQASANPLTLHPRDIERAAKRLPPGAHRIIVALRELSLLRPSSNTQFAIRPHFIARLLHSIAKDRTLSSLPVFWGEALLKPNARGELLDALSERVALCPEAFAEGLLEVVEAESAPLVCALEVGFVLIGLELLAGGELPDATATALLEEQNALLLVDLAPLPQRRTVPLEVERLTDSEGAFYLAAFALGEPHRKRRIAMIPLLDPWNQTEPPQGWGLLLDAITTTVRSALSQKPRWLLGALRLLEQLRQTLGANIEPSSYETSASPDDGQYETGTCVTPAHHPLFGPALILDAVELSVLEHKELHELFENDWQFELLLLTIEARGKNKNHVLSSICYSLIDANEDALLDDFVRKMPKTFWSDPSTEPLVDRLLSTKTTALTIPWQELTVKAWSTWSRQSPSLDVCRDSVAPWHFIPDSVGEALARTASTLSRPVQEVVWKRWPEVGIYQIEQHRILRPTVAVNWLASAPPSITESLATAAIKYEWYKADARLRVAIMKYLLRGLGLRMPGWAVAYECLHRFESERQRYETLAR
jgi:hypothetical protein